MKLGLNIGGGVRVGTLRQGGQRSPAGAPAAAAW